jgi:cytochrome b involved in lipid metabolism
MSVETKRITFIYNGTEYDATAYSDKHPGGRPFIENMNA